VQPLLYVRTEELLLRWIELSAFGSAIFRTHVGLSTSPRNAQVYDNDNTILHFAKFAKIFAHLAPYRLALMKDASEKGWPLIRHMAAHFAYDSKVWDLTYQFLFGEELLVAPVLDPAPHRRNGDVSLYSYFLSALSSPLSYAAKLFQETRSAPVNSQRGSAMGPLNIVEFRWMGVSQVDVYIPAWSDWVHLWTGAYFIL
jgi:alpha-glucosidase (family GH31 glycosyl hydrolase)